MQSTPQHVYATNLKQRFGYPLRNPQLADDGKLEETYRIGGLQIGDIGHVDKYGKFNIIFNIKHAAGNFSQWKFPPGRADSEKPTMNSGGASCESIPQKPRAQTQNTQSFSVDLAHFDQSPLTPAFDANRVFMTGVTQDVVGDSRPGHLKNYEFTAYSKEGAILILPDGAMLLELNDEYLAPIRSHIAAYALDWCKHTKKDSLYLVTGVYKAKSWTLGSFDDGICSKKIIVEPEDNPTAFAWKPGFDTDSQQAPKENPHVNQAVFIKGFKITVKDQKLLNLECLQQPEGWFAHILDKLRVKARKLLSGPSTVIEYFPRANLTEPSHPLDIVNDFLLERNPDARLAVTHDNDWIDMLDHGLPLEKLMEKGYVRSFIETYYHHNLDSKNGDTTDDVPEFLRGHGEGIGECKQDECPEIPAENSRLVITHMRLESFDVGNVDSGVCVFVQFGTTTRRTNNKPYAGIIEWDDEITLPSEEPVYITVRGTFQLGSKLGTREISAKKKINAGDMPGSAYTLKFPFGNSEPRSSLLITLERHFSYSETDPSCEENSGFVHTTTRGFEDFYSYHRERKKERLDGALEHFRRAKDQCGPDSERCAVACFNLATAEFVQCQENGIYSQLQTSIDHYREALQACGDSHQDRPAILLLLAQVLLSCHGQEYDEFIVEEIEELLVELPPDDSRNRRTADAILATCRFYHAINAEHPADVDGLLADFERGAYTPPYGYFDRPHLLHKLGLAFWRRFRSLEKLDDLDKAIDLNAEALQVPSGHNDRNNIAACLGNSLLCGLEARGELRDVDTSVGLLELGKKVLTMLDGTSYAEGTSAPSEDLQKQIDLSFAVAQLREQIELMSSVERVRQAAADDTPPGANVENPIDDWNRDEEIETECRRQLGVLLSFLGGEGDSKMREALEILNPEWPYKFHKIVTTMQALEKHLPYFDTVLARRLRFVVEGWC